MKKNSRKFLFYLNPIAGTGNKSALKATLEAKSRAAGIPFEIFPTTSEGGYLQRKDEILRKGFTDIIIAGGDGTINQIVGELRVLNLPFGVIPCGSGNGLALSAGLSKKVEMAFETILSGHSKLTDAFLINDRFACMLCGIGFDAAVAHDFANDPKRGLTTYIRKTLANFLTAKTFPFKVKLPGKVFEGHAFFISIANSNQFGNNFTIAPQASLHDGLVDIVIMQKQNKLAVLYNSIRQVGGMNKRRDALAMNLRDNVLYFQANEMIIENPSSALLHIDGDPSDTDSNFKISVLKDCFRLICPAD